MKIMISTEDQQEVITIPITMLCC